ncbi:YggT family protein [Candidatus Gracilibacteria bacterium]|nr:YggT family protein [Candidatus Gracilibacteria bacterium]
MTTLVFTLIIFLELIIYIVIFDIILSWLQLFGLKWRPKFIVNIIDPLYNKIKSIIPTNIGPVDFTPIVIFIGVYFIKGVLFILFPETQSQIQSFL